MLYSSNSPAFIGLGSWYSHMHRQVSWLWPFSSKRQIMQCYFRAIGLLHKQVHLFN
jgi:hypothetical protein